VSTLLRLNDSVEALFSYSQIIVTGPQRSGTTFTARAIAATMAMSYVDENEVKVREKDLLMNLLRFRSAIVVQAPGCTHLLHDIDEPDTAIVWVRRPIKDILESQSRVKWSGEEQELRQYRSFQNQHCPPHIHGSAAIKTWHWDSWQKSACKVDTFEMNYGCKFLTEHDLWVNKSKRSNFGIRQWAG